MPRNGILGTRRPRSGLQLAPGIQTHAHEWNSGNSKNTKWPIVGSGHFKIMSSGNSKTAKCVTAGKKRVPGSPRHPSGICPCARHTPSGGGRGLAHAA
eukprot:3029199-Pyramimonas_sp.AAC.1